MKKKNITDFIKESKIIHGDKYDYSHSIYLNNKIKVDIICPEHGIFKQIPTKHINSKQGCPKCATIRTHNRQRKSKEDFISESKTIHGNKYDYSLVTYNNFNENVSIICPKHGIFEQRPSNHLSGKGCKYCGGTSKLDKTLFIYKSKNIHGDKYDYSLVNYINGSTKIKIICAEHGIFEQTPNNHLSKEQGCYKCLDRIYNSETFIKKSMLVHNDIYNYSLTNYITIDTPVKIICKKHGIFEQKPNSHLRNIGCPSCGHINSKYEKEIISYLKTLAINVITNNRSIIPPLELDIYIPSHKLAIEFNGLYWHSDEFLDKKYHLNKTKECEKIGIALIHIFEDEWIDKKEIVKSRLKNILGLTTNKIYARKCEIKEVSNNETKEFLIKNHIQGNIGAKVKLGLFFKKELVSLMTFGYRPMINSSEYEIIRFCNKLDTTVIGGAQKLLKFFIKKYNPKEITSYCDKRWSRGNLYEKLGFSFIKDSPPNFFYIINRKRHNRLQFQKHKLIKNGFDPNKTASQIMLEEGIKKIYDCGSKKYYLKF